MKKVVVLCLIFALVAVGGDLLAQCPMCRATAESNLANGGTEGKGLNQGILFLLSTPYVIVVILGYIWWRNRRQEREPDMV